MAELGLDTPRAGIFEHFSGQLRFDQAGQHGIDANAGAGKGVGRRLRQIVHRRLARAVGDGAGIGAQRCGRRGEDDRTVALGRHVAAGVFDARKQLMVLMR